MAPGTASATRSVAGEVFLAVEVADEDLAMVATEAGLLAVAEADLAAAEVKIEINFNYVNVRFIAMYIGRACNICQGECYFARE